jgi:hypothetical protein
MSRRVFFQTMLWYRPEKQRQANLLRRTFPADMELSR